tara:strand:+ start:247 stop:705 length:459 start_codon:yes stop_codon:yes gene_type:complete
MIISCNNCNKEFDVNSELIPEKGRLLLCSSCNHQWFFKKKILANKTKISITKNIQNIEDLSIQKKEKINFNEINNSNEKQNLKNIKKKEKITNKRNGVLSLTLVFIISFIAIIILLDTFKYPLSKILPDIEIILYNLYESIKDIILFFKDLI